MLLRCWQNWFDGQATPGTRVTVTARYNACCEKSAIFRPCVDYTAPSMYSFDLSVILPVSYGLGLLQLVVAGPRLAVFGNFVFFGT